MPDLTLDAFDDTPRDRLEELLRQEAKTVLGRLPDSMVNGPGICPRARWPHSFRTRAVHPEAAARGEE